MLYGFFRKKEQTMKLTQEEFDNELSYLVSKQIIKDLLEKRLINEKEYQDIKEALLKEYKPLISSLFEGIDICAWYK